VPRRTKLNTRAEIIAELERSYEQLRDGVNWELNDREYWNLRVKILETALKAADDSDVLGQITALEERLDGISKPLGTVTPIGARKQA
jgi:hypothetical protein